MMCEEKIFVTTVDKDNPLKTVISLKITEDSQETYYHYNYMTSKLSGYDSRGSNAEDDFHRIITLAFHLMASFGYPLELELALTKNGLYLLQIGKVGDIDYDRVKGLWYQLSLSPKKFIYSLNADNYNSVLIDYAAALKKKSDDVNTCLMLGNVYYNLNSVRSFIDDVTTCDKDYFAYQYQIASLVNSPKHFFKHLWSSLTRKYQHRLQQFISFYPTLINSYHKKYNTYCHQMVKVTANNIESFWSNLVFDDYAYLRQNHYYLKILILSLWVFLFN